MCSVKVEVCLFGSNICDLHPMPPKDEAPAMARRLKQLGFNFIRLHYFDFAKAPEGILNADMQTLNPEKLDQFDWLVSHLKENGIYVDINLHICRPYAGQPKELHRFGKGIDYIHDPYVESQKRYARLLIGYVGGRDFQVGDVRFHVGKGIFRSYANISLVALDEKAVCESRRLLLTAVARVENKGQTWDEKRGGVIDWGEGPTLAEPVPLTLILPGSGWQARALNGKGQPAVAVAMAGPQLTTDPAHATLWYLITRP